VVRIILQLLVATYFAAFGVLSIIRPEKVRDFYIRQYTRGLGNLKKLGDPTGWDRYFPRASVLRIFGIISLLASILIIYSLLRR